MKALLTATLTILLAVTTATAGYKTNIGGITVKYSKDGAFAYYNTTDGTLTVNITDSGGSLSIRFGDSATGYWGEYCDIYIQADNASLKSMNIVGSCCCGAFVAGQVGYTSKFSLKNGVVGNTDYYGPDFGLGMTSTELPTSITLKNAIATAQVLGYSYLANPPAQAKVASTNAPAKLVQDPVADKTRRAAQVQLGIEKLQKAAATNPK